MLWFIPHHIWTKSIFLVTVSLVLVLRVISRDGSSAWE